MGNRSGCESSHVFRIGTGGGQVPWTPRGVAQAWRVAASPDGHLDDGAGYHNPFHDSAGEDSEVDSASVSELQTPLPDLAEITDARAAEVPKSYRLTLAQDAAGLSVYSVVYSVVLANAAVQSFVRGLLWMIAKWVASPARLMWFVVSTVEARYRTSVAAHRSAADELELLSQQNRERLLRRDGVLHHAPTPISDDNTHSSNPFSTPILASSTASARFSSPIPHSSGVSTTRSSLSALAHEPLVALRYSSARHTAETARTHSSTSATLSACSSPLSHRPHRLLRSHTSSLGEHVDSRSSVSHAMSGSLHSQRSREGRDAGNNMYSSSIASNQVLCASPSLLSSPAISPTGSRFDVYSSSLGSPRSSNACESQGGCVCVCL